MEKINVLIEFYENYIKTEEQYKNYNKLKFLVVVQQLFKEVK
jgi:hypothetical protein